MSGRDMQARRERSQALSNATTGLQVEGGEGQRRWMQVEGGGGPDCIAGDDDGGEEGEKGDVCDAAVQLLVAAALKPCKPSRQR